MLLTVLTLFPDMTVDSFNAERLYEMQPDKLYCSDKFDAWYAFYDIELCALTNASGKLDVFSYEDKAEYREVRRLILNEYGVREVVRTNFDD